MGTLPPSLMVNNNYYSTRATILTTISSLGICFGRKEIYQSYLPGRHTSRQTTPALSLWCTIMNVPAIAWFLFSEYWFQCLLIVYWGIIFPETTSLFMDCLKLIVQFSSDKNKAQGIHVSSLPERRITHSAGPWECLFTSFCRVHPSVLFRLTFNIVLCCHASTSSPPYPQTKYQAKNCPLVILSRPS